MHGGDIMQVSDKEMRQQTANFLWLYNIVMFSAGPECVCNKKVVTASEFSLSEIHMYISYISLTQTFIRSDMMMDKKKSVISVTPGLQQV